MKKKLNQSFFLIILIGAIVVFAGFWFFQKGLSTIFRFKLASGHIESIPSGNIVVEYCDIYGYHKHDGGSGGSSDGSCC